MGWRDASRAYRLIDIIQDSLDTIAPRQLVHSVSESDAQLRRHLAHGIKQ
jgi:hypothetical protein